jgi:hypothetical protein
MIKRIDAEVEELAATGAASGRCGWLPMTSWAGAALTV